MKKTAISLGILAILAGVVMMIVGSSLGGWDFDNLKIGDYVMTESNDFSENVTGVDISVQGGKVEVVRGDAYKVECSTDKRFTYDVSEKDGKITVTGKYTSAFWRVFNWWNNNRVKVYVPTDLKTLDIDSSNSPISLADMTIETVIVKTDNGGMSLSRVNFGKCEMDTSNGNITVENSTFGSLSIKSSNGRITASSLTAAGEIKATSSNGKVMLERISAAKIAVKTSNGDMTADSIEAADISFVTSNGDIEGEIVGVRSEYTIDCSTSNGTVSPSNQTGSDSSKKLYAHSSNGDIEFTFTSNN